MNEDTKDSLRAERDKALAERDEARGELQLWKHGEYLSDKHLAQFDSLRADLTTTKREAAAMRAAITELLDYPMSGSMLPTDGSISPPPPN